MAEPTPDPGARSRGFGLEPLLHPGQLDHLGQALLLLARELWITRDRLAVLEEVLAEQGVDVRDAIRDRQPSGALAARLEAERTAFAERLIAALAPAPPE